MAAICPEVHCCAKSGRVCLARRFPCRHVLHNATRVLQWFERVYAGFLEQSGKTRSSEVAMKNAFSKLWCRSRSVGPGT